MSKSKYEKTISKLKTTEKFQSETIEKLKASLENEGINNKKVRYNYRKIGTIAATIVFIFAIGVSIRVLNEPKSNIVDEVNEPSYVEENDNYLDSTYLASLPKLSITKEFGGMGFAALMAYNVEELRDGNPWTIDSNIKTMPVFKNRWYGRDPSAIGELGLTGEEMLKRAKEVAKLIKININESYTKPTAKEIEAFEAKTGEKANKNPYIAVIKGDGVEISVDSLGRVEIRFEQVVELPNKYSFSYTNTSAEDAEKTMKYLVEEYKQVIGLKSPKISLFGDYTFNGDRIFRYNAFEGEGSLINSIINYNFNEVSFCPTDNGDELASINIYATDLSEVIGNYPIITVDEAKNLLVSGQYITSVPEELPGEEYVASVNLMYRKDPLDEVLMPYYEFLVEMPSMKLENGLNTYGIYYVPAVEAKYIENMPKYDGSFN